MTNINDYQNNDINPDSESKDKKYKTLERVTIEDNLKDKLNLLTKHSNDALSGIATVTKSDVMNLILKLHLDELSKQEIDELKKIHFDVFKYLSWMQTQAKAAKDNGSEVSLKELFDKSNEFISNNPQPVKIRKKRTSKKNLAPDDKDSEINDP